jgi:large subunit ribosomal protein L15
MQSNNLKKNRANRKAKQVGRGGTRGKTSGRGTKGQNARSGRKKRPEMRDIIKRIPKLRGRGVNFLKSRFLKPVPINLDVLEKNFSAGETVNTESLIKKGIVKSGERFKILGRGKLEKKLVFENVKTSKSVNG